MILGQCYRNILSPIFFIIHALKITFFQARNSVENETLGEGERIKMKNKNVRFSR